MKADGSLDANKIAVADAVFSVAYNPGLVHQVVVSYMAAGRAGTKAQKNRSAVRGGGRKPHKQEGTGRARAGSRRSPIWRGRSVTVCPTKARNFCVNINKKMKNLESTMESLNSHHQRVLENDRKQSEKKYQDEITQLKAAKVEENLPSTLTFTVKMLS